MFQEHVQEDLSGIGEDNFVVLPGVDGSIGRCGHGRSG